MSARTGGARRGSEALPLPGVQQLIVGFHQDERGGWVAELACGHQRHVRHQPPFHLASWVLDEEGRQQRLGTPLECGICDRERRRSS
jgi:Protein of unknown function (DUF3565)